MTRPRWDVPTPFDRDNPPAAPSGWTITSYWGSGARLRHDDDWPAEVSYNWQVVAAQGYLPRLCYRVRLEYAGCRPADHARFRREIKAWMRDLESRCP